MGAVKEMIMGLGEINRVMADPVAVAGWERATGTTVTVAEATVEVRGKPVTVPTISATEARRLLADKRLSAGQRDDLLTLVEAAGIDPHPGCCPICGDDNVTFAVRASFSPFKRLTIINNDEPEGPCYLAGAYCEECEMAVLATPPEWTTELQYDAMASNVGHELRDALVALHRAAVDAGLTGPAVEAAAKALSGIGFDVARGKFRHQA